MASSSTSEGLTDIGGSTGSKGTDDNTTTSSSLQSWKTLIDISIAKSRKIRGSNYVQLATVQKETMEPRCRTVVFRGFISKDYVTSATTSTPSTPNDNMTICKMITDKRSAKVQEDSSKMAEMVWWFPKSNEQYRIRGRLMYIGAEGKDVGMSMSDDDDDTEQSRNRSSRLAQLRKEQWGNLSDPAREQFYWSDPGIPYDAAKEVIIPAGGRDAETGKVLQPPPDTFLLMLLIPSRVDYLRLGDNYHQVDELKGEQGDDDVWVSSRRNP